MIWAMLVAISECQLRNDAAHMRHRQVNLTTNILSLYHY